MASPRTVSVTVLLDTTLAVEDAGAVSALADVVRACPGAEPMVDGLRDGGWRMEGSAQGDAEPGWLSVRFSKKFTGATPIIACENARGCGVLDEHGPVFDWTPDDDDDEDGAWDRWDGEL
jgi:hypothetical protein